MDSKLLLTIHLVTVNLFVVLYLVKNILLFTNTDRLDRFSKMFKVPEMIISTLFLVSGIWLFATLGAIKSLQIIKLVLVFVSIPLAVVGFKKHKKAPALLALLLILGAYGISESSRSKPYLANKVEINGAIAGDDTEGLKIFLGNCAMCHGTDGNKEYRGATPLSASVMNEDAAISIITSGIKKGTRGTMPAFAAALTPDEIKVVGHYIQVLKNKTIILK